MEATYIVCAVLRVHGNNNQDLDLIQGHFVSESVQTNSALRFLIEV